jgi:hypothetical protein
MFIAEIDVPPMSLIIHLWNRQEDTTDMVMAKAASDPSISSADED